MKVKRNALPEKISVSDLARLSGYTSARVYQLIEDGIIPQITNNSLPFSESIECLFEHSKSQDTDEMSRARLRKTQAEAVRIERQNKMQSKKIVPYASIATDMKSFGAGIARLLRSKLEGEYPPQVAGKTMAEARAIGMRLYDEIVDKVQQEHAKWVTQPSAD